MYNIKASTDFDYPIIVRSSPGGFPNQYTCHLKEQVTAAIPFDVTLYKDESVPGYYNGKAQTKVTYNEKATSTGQYPDCAKSTTYDGSWDLRIYAFIDNRDPGTVRFGRIFPDGDKIPGTENRLYPSDAVNNPPYKSFGMIDCALSDPRRGDSISNNDLKTPLSGGQFTFEGPTKCPWLLRPSLGQGSGLEDTDVAYTITLTVSSVSPDIK